MNRRRFLELLGTAAVGSAVAYSFPSIIVPRNIVVESMWVYPTLYGYPHGLAHFISNGRVLFGYDTVTFKVAPPNIITLP